jgi:hypothetical protein
VERINAHTLSGGEKSVVTMLFLLTLQQVQRGAIVTFHSEFCADVLFSFSLHAARSGA